MIETMNLNKIRPYTNTIPSIIKWTGSKRAQAPAIARLAPEYNRYIEPFLGGGALLYLAAHPGSICGDIYDPLIGFWRLIQSDPFVVIDDYEKKWSVLNDELDAIDIATVDSVKGIPKIFYSIRDDFNRYGNPLDLNFLMRTCVNGIVRFNSKGKFNNSFHLTRRGMKPDSFKKIVLSWNRVIKDVLFLCQDYSETLQSAEKYDFIYLDPPYAGNKQRYINDLDINRFFIELEKLNNRDIKWALSFDGIRGNKDLTYNVPKELYRRRIYLNNGLSSVNKVLNGPIEAVSESLYLNF